MTTQKTVQRSMRVIGFTGLLLICLLPGVTPVYGIRLVEARLLFEISDSLSQPSDVAVAGDGKIYVVDGVNSKIRVFSPSGRALASFGSAGTGPGEFKNALGIDIDRSGRVYIADAGNHRVQIFDPDGNFIAALAMQSNQKHPPDPTDVAVDESRNRCYVVDNDNHQILVYDLATLKRIDTYGGPGSGKRAFRYPFLLALDKAQYLYIVDVINTRVQVLNPEGLFVNFIGGWGVEKGEFYRPKGVALDTDDRIYVSDSYMGVIQIFDSTGKFLAAVGQPGQGAVKKFKTPVGIFLDRRNRLYVVEMFANKVSVYHLAGISR
ncbi:MAG: NHL repeat-containing protein [Deltaproteobacteria bacterium]|jgi:DNA-binding beta-propeller fold protein YncE|nr:NHL repeat-containing protein [Deltaproteobacteria bacterium]